VNYEREKIILNGDRWVLLDFYIPSVNLAIELDGSQHRDQKRYDQGRSMWLGRQGIKTVRFWNKAVMDGKAEEMIRQMLGLS
jgi:very-short-patch-repair endonuclease